MDGANPADATLTTAAAFQINNAKLNANQLLLCLLMIILSL